MNITFLTLIRGPENPGGSCGNGISRGGMRQDLHKQLRNRSIHQETFTVPVQYFCCATIFSFRNVHFLGARIIFSVALRPVPRGAGASPVSRGKEPCKSVRERFSLMLLTKRFEADLNRPLARLLSSAEIFAQKRESLLLN
jgi:hypothetical protein